MTREFHEEQPLTFEHQEGTGHAGSRSVKCDKQLQSTTLSDNTQRGGDGRGDVKIDDAADGHEERDDRRSRQLKGQMEERIRRSREHGRSGTQMIRTI